MTDIREAFFKAARENPAAAAQIHQSAKRAREADREDRKYEALGRRYNFLGNAQYQINVRSFYYKGERNPKVLRGEWRQLRSDFDSAPEERRIQLLTDFAGGLRVTEEPLHRSYSEFFNMMSGFFARDKIRQAEASGYQIQAEIFMDAIWNYEEPSLEDRLRLQLQLEKKVAGLVTVNDAIAVVAQSLPTIKR